MALHKRASATFLFISVSAIASLGISGGRRALTETTSELQPLTVRLQAEDFALRIPAYGELQSAESLAVAVPNVPANRLRIATVVPDGRHVNKGDVLVEFEPGTRVSYFTLGDLQQDLTDLLGRHVDLKTKTTLSEYVRERVLEAAEPIYVRR